MPQTFREARWYRSMLFVPGHKIDWMLKAPKYGADALVFDLEDSVAVEDKASARESVAGAMDKLKGANFGRFVRLNGWRTGHILLDLMAVVGEGLDGVMLPKIEDPDDVAALDRVLSELENTRGLPPDGIEIAPLAETAIAMYKLYEICMSSQRVRRAGSAGGGVNGGDGARALGITVGEDGDESIYFGAYSVLQARAAGVTQIGGGLTTTVGDLDLVRRRATRAKRMGATGSLCIHPSHVAILNEVYSPSSEEIAQAYEIVKAMAAALARGDAAARHGTEMVDYAHVRTALDLLKRAKSVGIDVGDVPKIEVPSY